MSAIAKQLDLQAITQRITSGEYASHIARELGISPQILSYHLRKLPDWQDTLETAHEVRLDESDRAIDEAVRSRDFELARARTEQLKRREWRAERECKRWSPRQEVTHIQGISITEALEQARQRVIDGEFRDCSEREGGTPSGFGEVT